ncbi:MAG: hypothetical protein IPO65_11540 [Saprospiraceae bacterium]|nr:hypothetical protein [Saprospiraceae bacterium]
MTKFPPKKEIILHAYGCSLVSDFLFQIPDLFIQLSGFVGFYRMDKFFHLAAFDCVNTLLSNRG